MTSAQETLNRVLQSGRMGVFCDFDGTISEKDMIGSILMEFAPDEALPLISRVKSGELTVQRGVEQLFALLPSSQYAEIEQFARTHTRIRAGFAAFVDYCLGRDWSFSVVSGGFDFFVEPAVRAVSDSVRIFCNRLNRDGQHLKVEWTYPCGENCEGGCGLCKPTIVDGLRSSIDAVIVVGDGVTDFKLARQADFVFARDQLLTLAQTHGLPHMPFETFDDIVQAMSAAQNV